MLLLLINFLTKSHRINLRIKFRQIGYAELNQQATK